MRSSDPRQVLPAHAWRPLLLAVHPNAGLLVAYSSSILDPMMLTYHANHQPGATMTTATLTISAAGVEAACLLLVV